MGVPTTLHKQPDHHSSKGLATFDGESTTKSSKGLASYDSLASTAYTSTVGPDYGNTSFDTVVEEGDFEDQDAQDAREFELTQNECLDLANQDSFRVSFLRKLSYEGVWVPKIQRPPSHQTVIIFDWDDTLLCTSYLNNLSTFWTMPEETERQLKRIGKLSQKLLEDSLRLGHTFIITNAMPMWVQYSAAKYVPEMLPTLEKVRVISARGKYEKQFPRVCEWKVQAFLDIQRQMDSQIITNLVSLGDSVFEMNATHAMAKQFDTSLVKTVKFHENPCPEALLKQLELVSGKFERIVENARNMKIALERKPGTN